MRGRIEATLGENEISLAQISRIDVYYLLFENFGLQAFDFKKIDKCFPSGAPWENGKLTRLISVYTVSDVRGAPGAHGSLVD